MLNTVEPKEPQAFGPKQGRDAPVANAHRRLEEITVRT